MAYEIVSNAPTVTAQSSGVVACCLRTLADMAERHHRQTAQRKEFAHLTDALKRDIGLEDTPRRSRDSLPPAMNGRFHLSL